MQYPTHWRMAFFAAFFFHLVVWLTGSFFFRYFHEPPVADASVQVLEWEDVAEEDNSLLHSPIAANLEEKQEEEPVQEQKPEEILEEEISPIIAEEDDIPTAKLEEMIEEMKVNQPAIVIRKATGNGGQQMGKPPIVLEKFYPADDLVKFRGRVNIRATISKEGKIIDTKVMVTSGKYSVDQIAMSAVRRWTFKPALDAEGKPMECFRMISIPFNVPHRK
ncbi:energy transducer TonB [Anaerosinus massiliensis]|uniref:energy transducer TonB n=1 Tax=Massilibacillus massiliensis TaxID=1806837 RepID=UPI000A62975B|nr:TonB family protein [Massilibacillus massiliensis]